MPHEQGPSRTLWFDVEDLFEYAAANPRPSGIQRLAYEIYRALQHGGGAPGRIRFVRHDRPRNTFTVVPWQTVAGLFEQLTSTPAPDHRPRPGTPEAPDGGGIAPESRLRWRLRRRVHRLPPALRQRLLATARLQWQACAAAVDLLGYLARASLSAAWRRPGAAGTGHSPPGTAGDFAEMAGPGDCLVVLGAPWSAPDYAGLVLETKRRFGMRFALLVFDIIPIRRPEWCDRGLVRAFRAWFTTTLPAADVVLAISRSTAGDVERFAAAHDIVLSQPVQVLPLGTGFGPAREAPPAASSRLPPAGSYVLFVSTIEARKNHLLLFRVWRRLLDDMPAAAVPTLVFAGRVGWLVDDLMKQLDNTGYLDGKIQLIEDASDADLASLYHGCQFTLFPSFYEGWGLPVTESFMFGKPCIAARGSSLPEAGGRLARYFDPESVGDAYGVIRATIEDPDGLRAWQAEVVRCFQPVPWRATADALNAALRRAAIAP